MEALRCALLPVPALCTQPHVGVCMPTRTHTHLSACRCTHTQAQCTHAHTQVHSCTHPQAHAHAHIQIHTHTHVHAHTQARVCTLQGRRPALCAWSAVLAVCPRAPWPSPCGPQSTASPHCSLARAAHPQEGHHFHQKASGISRSEQNLGLRFVGLGLGVGGGFIPTFGFPTWTCLELA